MCAVVAGVVAGVLRGVMGAGRLVRPTRWSVSPLPGPELMSVIAVVADGILALAPGWAGFNLWGPGCGVARRMRGPGRGPMAMTAAAAARSGGRSGRCGRRCAEA